MRIAGSKGGAVSFSVTMDSQLVVAKQAVGSKHVVLKGQCPGDGNKALQGGSTTKQGMVFVAVLQVEIFGESGSLQVVNDETLRVHQADWAVLYVTASSSFDGPFKDPSVSDKQPESLAFSTLANLQGLSFDDVLAAHLADYQPLFQRVSLTLGNHRCIEGAENKDSWELVTPAEIMESKTDNKVSDRHPWQDRIATKDRILNYSDDEDPGLVVLLFQFGRYLLIASSRPNTFVSNLQGIWNNSLHPAWR